MLGLRDYSLNADVICDSGLRSVLSGVCSSSFLSVKFASELSIRSLMSARSASQLSLRLLVSVRSASELSVRSLMSVISASELSVLLLIFVTTGNVWRFSRIIRGCIQKFPDWLPGARTVNGTALCH